MLMKLMLLSVAALANPPVPLMFFCCREGLGYYEAFDRLSTPSFHVWDLIQMPFIPRASFSS